MLAEGCGGAKTIGRFDAQTSTFRAGEYGCSWALPSGIEWEPTARRKREPDVLFEASSPSKLLFVFLGAESLDAELEDYFLMLKVKNRFDQRKGYTFFGKTSESVNGAPALRFVYSANVGQGETGEGEFTYANVLLKNRGYNFRLIVYTLSEAYERKRETIDAIIRGFQFME
jgi:hypothetical protein